MCFTVKLPAWLGLTKISKVAYLFWSRKNPKTQEDIDYSMRAQDFPILLRRLRDLEISLEDYYKLCKRNKSNLPFAERKKFEDAPVLMDSRRETDTNPENNCTYHNRMQVRSLA